MEKKKSKKLLVCSVIFLVFLIVLKIFLWIEIGTDADYEDAQYDLPEVEEVEIDLNEKVTGDLTNSMLEMVSLMIPLTTGIILIGLVVGVLSGGRILGGKRI